MAIELHRLPKAGDIESHPSLHIGDLLPGERRPPSLESLRDRWRRLLLAMRAMRAMSNNNTYRSLAPPTNNNRVSITVPDGGGGGFFQVIITAANALMDGFRVNTTNNNHNSGSQDGNGNGNNNEVTHNIDPELADANVPNSVPPANLALSLWIVALLTLSLVITTMLYKPARGVIFGRNKDAYYLTLAAIFIAGVIEVFTAMWISRSPDPNRHRFSFGRVVLCVSIGPLVAIIGITGFAFIEG